MNIELLKKRPVPQGKQEFEILLPNRKQVEIIDKRDVSNINREAVLKRVNNVVRNRNTATTQPNTESVSDDSDTTTPKQPKPQPKQQPKEPKEQPENTDKEGKSKDVPVPVVVEEEHDNEIKISDFEERLPQRKDRVIMQASSYYMNNRKIFLRKMNELFKGYVKEIKSQKSNISCERKEDGEFSLLTHQKVIQDYLNLYSPYRGILLYHGLGSGKTCSAIALAEGMKSDKRIIVMTPASLKMNFFSELKKCGDLLYKKNQHWEFVSVVGKTEYVSALSSALNLSREYIRRRKGAWMIDANKAPNFGSKTAAEQKEIDNQINEMIRVKYTDINYNGMNEKKMEKITGKYSYNPFDNSVVVIDEAHNFVSRIVNKLKEKSKKSISYRLYEYLMSAQNCKVVLLSGTPIINYPNEIGVLFNILRGYITTWTFPIEMKPTQKINTERILELFDREGFVTHDYVEYSGNSLIITRNPFGFVNAKKRGPIKNKMKGGAEGDEKPVEKAEKLTTEEEDESGEQPEEQPQKESQDEPQELQSKDDSKEEESEKVQEEQPEEESNEDEPQEEIEDDNKEQSKEEEPQEQPEQPEQPDEETKEEEPEVQPEEQPEEQPQEQPQQQPDEELEEPSEEGNMEEEPEEPQQPEEETKEEKPEEETKEEEPQEQPPQVVIPEDTIEEIDDLKSEVQKLQDEIAELKENSFQEIAKQQQKDYKKEVKELKRQLEEQQKEESKQERKEKKEEEKNTMYDTFENNANRLRDYIRTNIGFGGANKSRKNKGKSNKRRSRKSKFAERIEMVDEVDDEELQSLIENFYRQGYNHEFQPHSGGFGDRPYFDKYNGVRVDRSGNISNDVFQDTIINILRKYKIDIHTNQISVDNYKALPDNPDDFNEMFVDVEKGEIINENLFKRRILGLTSHFRSAQEELMPTIIKNNDNENYFLVKSIMSDHQFTHYEKVRKTEAEQEKKNKNNQRKNQNKKADDVYKFSSTYRIFSRAACNFVFPPEIVRPLPKKVDDLNEDEFDGIKKKEINNRDDYNPEEDNNITEDVDYQKKITTALKELAKKDRKGVSIHLNREKLAYLSPKMLSLLDNLQHPDNTGLQLIYSQFRTIEGIGILKLVLEANGYAEFKIKKSAKDGWTVVQKIGDEAKPKFVLYTGTESEEEKEIIRNVYNGQWDMIPTSIAEHIKKIHKNNFMGEIIKIFMITSSGAEGINLRNTRFVHIVEPYWHMVRTNQVIGRARRICSHEDLPKSLRNVKIYLYLTVLSEEQKTSERNIELRIRDVSKLDSKTPITTDESLFEIASLKEKINSQLLNAVKASAFDCSLYSSVKGDDNVVCYNLGKIESNDFNSVPDIEVDKNEKEALNERFITWSARKLEYRRKMYALNEETNELYDLGDYEAAVSGLGDLTDKKVGDLVMTKGKPKVILLK